MQKITLEHILPQNPNEKWKDSYSNKAEHEQWCDTLGNLTLIEKNLNKDIGNISFIEKKEIAYSKSELALNRDISEYDTWNIESIEKRGKMLAELAESCWKIQY